MLFIITFPPLTPALSLSQKKKKKAEQKGILEIENPPSPQKSYLYRFTLPLSLPLSPNFQICFLSRQLFLVSRHLQIPRNLFSLWGKNSSILPETSPEPPNPRESSSMQPRRSRFTELIDIPLTNASCSSPSELSLDDVLRETEQKLSQNRVLSLWNGWDHVGSGVQRQHSMPRNWLRRKNTGEIPRNVFGPSKGPRF